MCFPGPLGIVAPHVRNLLIASGVQARQQAFQFRIVKYAHGLLPSLA
jgi:hypothetical protein